VIYNVANVIDPSEGCFCACLNSLYSCICSSVCPVSCITALHETKKNSTRRIGIEVVIMKKLCKLIGMNSR